MQHSLAISQITGRIALTFSLVLALAFPAGYFLISYRIMAGCLEAEAELNARSVSALVAGNPLLWRTGTARLDAQLSGWHRNTKDTVRILDGKGGLLLESRGERLGPWVRRSQQLVDAGTSVGSIEISRSLRPLLLQTGWVTLLGVAIGLLVFRLFPHREIIRAQKKLEDANSFLNMVMESSTNAIVVLDRAGRVRMANRRSSGLSGFSPEELVGRPFTSLFGVNALDRVSERLAEVSNGESATVSFDAQFLNRNGRLVEISCGAAPFSQAGRPAGMVLSAEDITGRKKLEQQLRGSAAELERSNDELRSFAYIVSHDLRAPLVNIKGFSSELNGSLRELGTLFEGFSDLLQAKDRSRVAELFEQDVPEALDFINSSVVRMDRLINAILKLSRLGHRELNREPLQLREMVDAILKSMSHQLEERRASVSVGALPELQCDRIALEQILGNLLDNAVKYLDPERPGELSIQGESCAAGVTIHVRDNGRGIAGEDISRIFEIFRRAGRQDVQGEGMGLTYVKALVRKLHGQIWCDSTPGVGSTFSFTIPHPGSLGEDSGCGSAPVGAPYNGLGGEI